jgi:hypothetical protein
MPCLDGMRPKCKLPPDYKQTHLSRKSGARDLTTSRKFLFCYPLPTGESAHNFSPANHQFMLEKITTGKLISKKFLTFLEKKFLVNHLIKSEKQQKIKIDLRAKIKFLTTK